MIHSGLELNLSFALFCRFYSNEFKPVKSLYQPSIRRRLIPVSIARSNQEHFYSPVGSSGLPPALKKSSWIPTHQPYSRNAVQQWENIRKRALHRALDFLLHQVMWINGSRTLFWPQTKHNECCVSNLFSCHFERHIMFGMTAGLA